MVEPVEGRCLYAADPMLALHPQLIVDPGQELLQAAQIAPVALTASDMGAQLSRADVHSGPASNQDAHIQGAPRMLVVVDSGLEQVQTLVTAFTEALRQSTPNARVEVLALTPDPADPQQARDQLIAALDADQTLQAVYLLGHGAPGVLDLAGWHLDQAALRTDAVLLDRLAASLTPDGDLLIYGCDTGAGQAGADLLAQLAARTGADVAASDDATGLAALGGDWQLEVQQGTVTAVQPAALQSWQGLLQLTQQGQETRINATIPGYQQVYREGRSVAVGEDGRAWVAYHTSEPADGEGFGILLQGLDASGQLQGAPIVVSGAQGGDQAFGALALAQDGRVAVVWQDAGNDGDGWALYGRLFANDGTALTDAFAINTQTAGHQQTPTVMFDPDGSLLVVWHDEASDSPDDRIKLRWFDEAGDPLTDEVGLFSDLPIPSAEDTDRFGPVAAIDADGNLAFVWTEISAQGGPETLRGRIWLAGNSEPGNIFDIYQASATGVDVGDADVVFLADRATLAVAWRTGAAGNYYRLLAMDGTAQTDALRYAPTPATGETAEFGHLAATPDGGFIASYVTIVASDPGDIMLRQFDASGAPVGSARVANSTPYDLQYDAGIAVNSQGVVQVAWDGVGGGDDYGVIVQRFRLSGLNYQTTSLTTSESGGTATISFTLDAAPSADVQLSLSVSDDSEVSLSATQLVFNAQNWNQAHTVTITGLDDLLLDGDITSKLIIGPTTSNDVRFNGLYGQPVTLVNQDNDSAVGVAITVNTLTDVVDGVTSSLDQLLANPGNDGRISLREAILAANATSNVGGMDQIKFDFGAGGVPSDGYVIHLSTPLPTLTDTVLIDGRSAPGFATGQPVVVIDGGRAAMDGLTLGAGSNGSIIRGLLIRNFGGTGVVVNAGNQGSQIVGNWIGGMRVGSGQSLIGAENGFGLWVGGGFTQVGGDALADLNVISGNQQVGVVISGSQASDSKLQGNLIGMAPNGVTVLANGPQLSEGSAQIRVEQDAARILIGGLQTGLGNQVGGSAGTGILVMHNNTQASILGNVFAGQLGMAVDLAASPGVLGPDTNDPLDVDTGPNGLLNRPIIDSATTNGTGNLAITGRIFSTPNTVFWVDLYSADRYGTGFTGAGQRFLDRLSVTTDATGAGRFALQSISTVLQQGSMIAALATQMDANQVPLGSSEMSASVLALSSTGANKITVTTVADVVDAEATTISSLLVDPGPDGRISLREALLAANSTPNGAGPDEIDFVISEPLDPLNGHQIILNDELPMITEAVVIDGTTDPDYALRGNRPVIVLDGQGGVGDALVFDHREDAGRVSGLLIRHFSGSGIHINYYSNPVVIQSNWIGGYTLDGTASDTERIGGTGIWVVGTGNTIGGSVAGQGNLIGGTGYAGITFYTSHASFNTVYGNYIGLQADGVSAARINGFGIVMWDGANTQQIGGQAPGQGNRIAYTGATGILIDANTQNSYATVLGNLIWGTGGMPIDLGNNGRSVNDVRDRDSGPNDLQNSPIIDQAYLDGGRLRVVGHLDSEPNTQYVVQVFARLAQQAANTPPIMLLGDVDVSTDRSGHVDFVLNLNVNGLGLSLSDVIVATATSSDARFTSEESEAKVIVPTPVSVLVTRSGPNYTTEAGGTTDLLVTLGTRPEANVTLNISVDRPREAQLSQATLVFTPDNWNVIQVLRITGGDDQLADGDRSFTIKFEPSSSDPAYDLASGSQATASITLVNLDDDSAKLTYPSSTTQSYLENSGWQPILADAPVLSNASVLTWQGGFLSVSMRTVRIGSENIDLLTDGSLKMEGTAVLWNGTAIGQVEYSLAFVDAGQGAAPVGSMALTVTFNANASSDMVQELLDRVVYRNTDEAPLTDDRRISWTLTDARGFRMSLADAEASTITISTVNDLPVIGAQRTFLITENSSQGVQLFATDVDSAVTGFRWSIAGGADAGRFRIDALTGQLTLLQPADFEAPADFNGDNRYQILVSVTDAESGRSTAALTIVISDTNELAILRTPQTATTNDRTPVVLASFGSLTLADPDLAAGSYRLLLTPDSLVRVAVGDGSTAAVRGAGIVGSPLELSGNLAQINQTLALLTLVPTRGTTGSGSLVIDLEDLGATDGAALQLRKTMDVQISASPVDPPSDGQPGPLPTPTPVPNPLPIPSLPIPAPGNNLTDNTSGLNGGSTSNNTSGSANGNTSTGNSSSNGSGSTSGSNTEGSTTSATKPGNLATPSNASTASATSTVTTTTASATSSSGAANTSGSARDSLFGLKMITATEAAWASNQESRRTSELSGAMLANAVSRTAPDLGARRADDVVMPVLQAMSGGLPSWGMGGSAGTSLWSANINMSMLLDNSGSTYRSLRAESSTMLRNQSTMEQAELTIAQAPGTQQAPLEHLLLDLNVPETGSAVLTFGALWWAIKSGSLVSALAVGMPGMQSFDPLPLLSADAGYGPADPPDDDADPDTQFQLRNQEEDAVASMFAVR